MRSAFMPNVFALTLHAAKTVVTTLTTLLREADLSSLSGYPSRAHSIKPLPTHHKPQLQTALDSCTD